MNDNAKKWVAALESGEFKQTTLFLQYGGAYCCLGVACRVYEKETGVNLAEGCLSPDDGRPETLEIYPEVQEWLGLRKDNGGFGDYCENLTDINDSSGDFDEVIEVIKSEPSGLFVGGS